MKRLTKAERQAIVSDHVDRHGGAFSVDRFVDEVLEVGESHPAAAHFTLDKDAGFRLNLRSECRKFVQDLRIEVRVTVPEPVRLSLKVRTVEAPQLISPMATRSRGGGYISFDSANPDHRAELRRQAEMALVSWLDRYRYAMIDAGLDDEIRVLEEKILPALVAEAKEIAA